MFGIRLGKRSRRKFRPRKGVPAFGLWRRYRWFRRISVLVVAVLAAVHQLRQSEVLFPVVEPYDRALYTHWSDADGDCQDTRQEALIRDSLTPVTLSADGCRVVSGVWLDPFTGEEFRDPSGLDVDHMVPLAEAHRSGADFWQSSLREAYANDLRNPDVLAVVSASANRSKADRDPLSWLPPDIRYWCGYGARWVRVKTAYNLSYDPPEGLWLDMMGVLCGFERPKRDG